MNRRQKRMEDLREAKDKRMKKVAVALSVVLAVVLAFEVPSMLKSSGGSSAPAAATPTASTGAPPTASPGTAAAAVTPVASTQLPNSDALPRAGKSQLYAFSRFTAKDPFVQQVSSAAPSSSTGSSSSSSSNSSSNSSNPQSTSIASNGTAAAVTHRQGNRSLAVGGAARIAVNGRVQIVRVGTSFPSANPLFRLVSVGSNGVAKVGIASGSYSSGARTVSLVPGRTLTLVDTADGIRYQLRLIG